MTYIEFARPKGAKDKKPRKRRGKGKFRRNVERVYGNTKRAAKNELDAQLKPFTGPTRKERLLNIAGEGIRLGAELGVAAVLLNNVTNGGVSALGGKASNLARKASKKTLTTLGSQKANLIQRVKNFDEQKAFKLLEKEGKLQKIEVAPTRVGKSAKNIAKNKKRKSGEVRRKRDSYAKSVGLSRREMQGLSSLSKRGMRQAQQELRERARRK